MAPRRIDPVRLSIALASSGLSRAAVAQAAGCSIRALQLLARGELALGDRLAAGLASVVGIDAVRWAAGEIDVVVVLRGGAGRYRVQALPGRAHEARSTFGVVQ